MEILAFIGSAILFALFAMLVLFVLINISSRLAFIILFFTPLIFILIIPKTSIAFLAYQQMLLANGLVPVNNFHILLMLWSTLIGIILYTEFLTWYLGKGKSMKKRKHDLTTDKTSSSDTGSKNLGYAIKEAENILLRRN
ncbi:hypothetical protein [Methanolobus sp. WCC5]|uniref:hypothetical protein n=1 Tax=Methanolobus sp. WCC5 TaxID=3125785 RepID=UPI00324C6605